MPSSCLTSGPMICSRLNLSVSHSITPSPTAYSAASVGSVPFCSISTILLLVALPLIMACTKRIAFLVPSPPIAVPTPIANTLSAMLSTTPSINSVASPPKSPKACRASSLISSFCRALVCDAILVGRYRSLLRSCPVMAASVPVTPPTAWKAGLITRSAVPAAGSCDTLCI